MSTQALSPPTQYPMHRITFLLVFISSLSLSLPLLAQGGGGPRIRLENLTKVPGSDRGFPADDFYTFQRTQDPVNSNGQVTLHTEESGMRIHNDGTAPLQITRLTTTDTTNFVISAPAALPLSIAPGTAVDVRIRFVTDGGPDKRLVTEALVLESNATNPAAATATLRGAYNERTEGNNEISAQQVFAAFGFTTSFGRDDNGQLVDRPRSDYPTDREVDAGREGDMILSPFFVQADTTRPIQMIQLSALHSPSGAPTELRDTFSRAVVGGMIYNHGVLYHQTLLPNRTNESDSVTGDFTARIAEPFQILVAGYRSSGGGLNNQRKDELLGVRVYLAIDRNGSVIPNEYIVNQDYIGNDGCGEAGSANCDWNDNTSYIINARPLAEPTAGRIDNATATVGTVFSYPVNGAFDKGYAGNRLRYQATLADGSALPSWITLDASTATFTVNAPLTAAGQVLPITVTATDYNELAVSSTFNLRIVSDTPEAACTVVANDVNQQPVLDCTTGSVTLRGSSPAGYRWTGPDGFTATEATPTVTTPGTYVLRPANTDCATSDFVEVLPATNCPTIGENQPPVADARANPSDGQGPLNVLLQASNSTDPDGQLVSYRWEWAGAAATGRTVQTTFAQGAYRVVLTVTDDRGAQDRDTVLITVGSRPAVRLDSVYLEAECGLIGEAWTVDSTGQASGTTYVIPLESTSGDGPPADFARNRVRFTVDNLREGDYRLHARINAPSSAADSYWVRINDGTWYNWRTGIVSGTGFTWNAYPQQEFFLSGTNTIDFAFREAGSQLDKILLTRSEFVPVGVGEAGLNCFARQPEDTTTSLRTSPSIDLSLQLYPNPTTQFVTLRYSSPWIGPVHLEVTDALGRRVRSMLGTKQEIDYELVFDLGDLSPGTYYLRLVEKNKVGSILLQRQ